MGFENDGSLMFRHLTDCLASFGADSETNIDRLVSLCGLEMGAVCALYNRLERGLLCSLGRWNVPKDMPASDAPQGHICFDIIQKAEDEPLVIRHLSDSDYARTDPNVKEYNLQTYIGMAVKNQGQAVGSLCVVFKKDFVPSAVQLDFLRLAGISLGGEEARRQGMIRRQEGEERLKDISRLTSDIVYSCISERGGSYVIDWMAGATEPICGYSVAEIKDRKCWSFLVYDADLPLFREKVIGLSAGQERYCELRLKHKNGHLVWVASHAKCVIPHGQDGHLLLGALLDISEKKRTEAALGESRQRNQALLDANPDIIFVFDRDGRVLDVQVDKEDRLYIPSDRFLGKMVDEVLPADVAQRTHEILEEVARTHKLVQYEYQLQLKGETRNFESRMVPIHNGSFMAVVRDISDRKKLEEALERRILALTRPLGEVNDISFNDLFNLEEIQRLQDEFALATGVASIITDPDGKPITEPSNFTDLCSRFIRVSDIGRANCYRSDRELGRLCSLGPIVQPCLSGGLWDAGAAISVADIHVANWLVGQVRDETQTEEAMRSYAREIGADEESFLEAFRRVPSMSRQRFEQIASMLFTLSGQLSAMAYQNVMQARFIAERKRAETELAFSQEQLRLFVDANADLMFLKDRDLRYRMVNRANALFFGREAFEVIGRGDRDFMAENEALNCQLSDRIVLEEKRSITTEERVGDLIYEVKKMPVMVNGQVTGVAGIIRDITVGKRAQEELVMSESKFHAAFLISPDSININRLSDGKYLEINNGFTEIIGYTPEETIGKSSLELNIWADPTDRDRLVEGLRKNGYYENLEARFVHKNGEYRYGLMSARVIEINGETCILSITRDITERKRSEEERARLEAQLQQAQKLESVGRLAGGVAHDFNNMLGVILGHVEMALENMDFAHPLHPDLLEIQKAAERSADLTRQLLAFARKQTITPKVLDPAKTIDGMIKMIQRLIGEEIELIWKPPPDLWQVRMDPSQIDQILANLCVNARDAIDGQGIITIDVQNCHLEEGIRQSHPGFRGGDFLKLSISDNGSGMDGETMSKLFEPFFTTKELGKGTGLGLATVYGAVKQNEGFIDVLSEPGKGSTFIIYLPRYTGKDHKVQTGGFKPVDIGQETILLVEDEPSILHMTRVMLERNGYRVISAISPGEAIEKARQFEGDIHLLMTDVVMPEMNGRELARSLLGLYPMIKRLFMSGYTADVIAHQGVLEAGVHFIQKPFSMVELTSKIHELLGSS